MERDGGVFPRSLLLHHWWDDHLGPFRAPTKMVRDGKSVHLEVLGCVKQMLLPPPIREYSCGAGLYRLALPHLWHKYNGKLQIHRWVVGLGIVIWDARLENLIGSVQNRISCVQAQEEEDLNSEAKTVVVEWAQGHNPSHALESQQ
jgi:hypothetical protein